MLIGNVGREPEIRYLEGNQSNGSQTKVATFTLATSERFRDRNGETRENTEWHNIVAWRNNADVAEKFIHKGTQIYIEGKLRTRSYSDSTGNKKYTTEVVVDTLQLLGRRPDGEEGSFQQRPAAPSQPQYSQPQYSQPQYSQPSAPAQPAAPAADPFGGEPTDDLPF